MQLHLLKKEHKNRRSVSVGRGGKRGKTSGRGTKGQKARAGRKIRPELRDVIKRLPKLRGRGSNSLKSRQLVYLPVNLINIDKAFSAGETVSPASLLKKNLASRLEHYRGVKILGNGEISKALTFTGCAVSAPAKVKIEKAGGKIEVQSEKLKAKSQSSK